MNEETSQAEDTSEDQEDQEDQSEESQSEESQSEESQSEESQSEESQSEESQSEESQSEETSDQTVDTPAVSVDTTEDRVSPPGEPALWDGSPAPKRQGWTVAAAVVATLMLLAGGFGIGGLVFSEDSSPDPIGAMEAASVDVALASTGTQASEPIQEPIQAADPRPEPGPVVDMDPVQPAVAVARALSSSVVVIDSNSGQGSGIVWDAEAGYIVTNQHVVQGTDQVLVTMADDTQVDGEVVGGSTVHDVAVVRVDPGSVELMAATFAPDSTVEVGQLAIAIGAPFGLEQTVTSGIVSAVRVISTNPARFGPFEGFRPFPESDQILETIPMKMLQTDAAINSGNSGGVLADRQGRVVGMNTLIRTQGFDFNTGVGFAVPSDTIILISERIVNGESLDLGFLGITSRDDGSGEIRLARISDGSPAQVAGLEIGDVVVALDGEPMTKISELSAAVKLYSPGDRVELTIERDGQTRVVSVELGSYEPSE